MDEIAKGDAPEFQTREEFKAWLKDKPREWSVVLAARAALRVIPLVYRTLFTTTAHNRFSQQTSALFRAAAIGRVAAKIPARRFTNVAVPAFTAAAQAAIDAEAMGAGHAYDASYGDDGAAARTREAYELAFIARAAAATAATIYDAAHFSYAADATPESAYLAPDLSWDAVSLDAHLLIGGVVPAVLISEPLWLSTYPEWASGAWTRLRDALPNAEHWEVWIDWYEARLKKSRWSEKKELIYASVPLEVWKQGHVAANTWIYEELQKLQRKRPRREADALDDRDLIEQSPAPTSFRIVGDKIDAAPETADSIDETIASAFYDEAKRKARELRERLARAQADKRLQSNLALLEARLGASLADVSVGHLLPSLYSLERDFSVYNSEDGRKEHSLELIAALGDAAGAVRDFVSLFPKVRLIEAEALALRIVQQPETQDEIAKQGRRAIAAARESPLVTPAAVSALQDTEQSVTIARDSDERARQLSYLVLDLRNFARAGIALALKEVGGLAGDCWVDIRKKVPPAVGTLTRIGLVTLGLSTLVDQLAPAKIKLLKEVGGIARGLGKAIEETAPPKAKEKASAPEKSEAESSPRRDTLATEKNAPQTKGGKRTLQKRKR
jgi:hypothetical protein